MTIHRLIQMIFLIVCILLIPLYGAADEMEYNLPEMTFQRVITGPDGQPVQQAIRCDELMVRYRVKNTGSTPVQQARIEEELPEGMRTAQGDAAISIDIGRIPAGETVVEMVALSPEREMVFENTAMLDSSELRVRSDTSRVEIVEPQLALNVTSQGQDELSKATEYEIQVENAGSYPVRDAVVRLDLPEAVTDISISDTSLTLEGDRISVGRLAPGEENTFTLSFSRMQPGDVDARIVADAYCAETVARTLDTAIAGLPAIRIQTVDMTDPVPVGENTTYDISVKNQGSAEDLNVTLTGTLPEEMEFVSGQGQTDIQSDGKNLQFGKLDSLGPGEMATWEVVARANQAGNVRFRLELTSDANPTPVIEQEPTTIY